MVPVSGLRERYLQPDLSLDVLTDLCESRPQWRWRILGPVGRLVASQVGPGASILTASNALRPVRAKM